MVSFAATAATSVASAAPATPQPRLVRAAHEFEAQMMKELLKPMTSTNGLDGEDDDAATGSDSALTEFASGALGQALSERGGFGIATSIVQKLSHASNKPTATRVTKDLRGNAIIVPRMTKVISVHADKFGKE
jgi:Rod binding domain-containing protein